MFKVKKARKKPVEIEFMHFNNVDSAIGILLWLENKAKYKLTKKHLIIKTLEGTMTAELGDYIIKGVNGEFYPVKKDIFHKTYEIVGGHKQ